MSSSHLSPADYLYRSLSQLRGLTAVHFLSKLNFPESTIGVAVAFAVPHTVRRAVFLVSAKMRSSKRCYKLAEQRPVSVRTGGLSWAGERCSAFFVFQSPNHEVSHV